MSYQDVRYRDPEYRAKWNAANPEKVREYSRRSLEANREANRLRSAAYYAAHREEGQAKARAYYQTHKAQSAATRITRKYGLSDSAYAEMVLAQGGVCAICALRVPLSVDHVHATGAVRGLLCAACNFLIGHGKDDPKLLRRAAEYLEARR